MFHEKKQVEFELGSGQTIFGRVMHFGLRKNSNNFQFPLIKATTN